MSRPLSDVEFAAFQELVYGVTGIYLAPSKRELLITRLGRRLDALGLDDYATYYHFVQNDATGNEREELVNAITINKTSFFREAHHFELLRTRLIPELRARVAAGAPRRIRIWSAACSTGEEAYSLAMVAHRELAGEGYAIEIVASDIDTEVLARAGAGVYTAEQVAEIPLDLRGRYLQPIPTGGWRICDELRSLIQLHQVNLIRGVFPFVGTFDAIFLRNVIIYFDRPGQLMLFQRLRGLLADTSYLFLGHSESLMHLTDAFALTGRTVYQPVARRTASMLTTHRIPTFGAAVNMVTRSIPSLAEPTAPTIARIGVGEVIACGTPARIDAVIGACVTACVFDLEARVGGAARIRTDASGEPAVQTQITQLLDRMEQLGGRRARIQAKLVGGGGATARERERSGRDVAATTAALDGAGIPITGRRLGEPGGLELQFFTDSGRLLCRRL